MAHARRHFWEVLVALDSPLAKEAIERMGALYQIEDHIRGSSPEKRLAARQRYAVPVLTDMRNWMIASLSQIENKSALAEAFRYSLNRWEALCRYTQDGRLEIDNNSAERSIRGIGTGRHNYLDPQRYLQYVLERIADHPINRIEELLPWNVADQLNQPTQVTAALAA